MWIALTGTPGTGKSSIATLLQKQGYTTVRLHQLAKEYNCTDGIDTKRNSQLIDVDKLNNTVKNNFALDALIFFEGHLGHLLKAIDKVIILRCHPKKLKKRLMKKKFQPTKPYTIGQIDWSEEIFKGHPV